MEFIIMNNYFVKVIGMLPFPIEKKYTIKASNMATAVARAIRKYPKDVNGEKGRRMMIKRLTIKVERL